MFRNTRSFRHRQPSSATATATASHDEYVYGHCKSKGEQTKMISGDGIPRWSVYDSLKIIPLKPDALMAEINSAISSLEYGKSMKLLNSPAFVSKDKKSIDDGNADSLYDARKADEAYKAGLASLAAAKTQVLEAPLWARTVNCLARLPRAKHAPLGLILSGYQLRTHGFEPGWELPSFRNLPLRHTLVVIV
ncbi:hypothetical protein OSB04_005259 [Centaurea solstitialis]|uniref:Uncharacterized protein n=1 Tax=Centaurea solstitialis TaxID=347529 RepID=A0AA38TFN7_9ASTR|nr:hypothetical protein OSB04_005259 [Centaurea solstitialis]